MKTFDELVGEAAEVSVDGWDFTWLDGRATRNERLRLEFFDVGAVIFFLRKVIWTVPGFTVDRYHDRLDALHRQIQRDGVFHSTMSRTLFEARKPGMGTDVGSVVGGRGASHNEAW